MEPKISAEDFCRGWEAVEAQREKNAKIFLTPAERAEITAWYLAHGSLVWGYKPAAVRLWADEAGFGVEFQIADGGKWWSDGDLNDDTVAYFRDVAEWRKYADGVGKVNTTWIAARFLEYREFFGTDPHACGIDQEWVLHPNTRGGVGVLYDNGDESIFVDDWKRLGAHFNALMLEADLAEDAKRYEYWEPVGRFGALAG